MNSLILAPLLIFSLISTPLYAQTVSRPSVSASQIPKNVTLNNVAPLCRIENFKHSEKLVPGALFFVSTQPQRAVGPIVARTGNQVLRGIPADAQQSTVGPTIRKVYFSYEQINVHSYWRVAEVHTVNAVIPAGTTDWVEFRVPSFREPFLPQKVTVHVETSQCNTQFTMDIVPQYVRQRWFPPVNTTVCSQPEGPTRQIWQEARPSRPTSQTRHGGKRSNFCGPWTTYHFADAAIIGPNGRVTNLRQDVYEIWHGGVARDIRVGIVYLNDNACTFEETITHSKVAEGHGGPYVLNGKVANGVTPASTNVSVNWYSKTPSGGMCPYHLLFEASVPRGFPTQHATYITWATENHGSKTLRMTHDQTSSVFRWLSDDGKPLEQRLNLK
ncbi:MAG: hypothetical protein QM645_12585 [Asticcacaulis sp.]